MFRRKEEGSLDSSDASATPMGGTAGVSSTPSESSHASTSPSSPSAAATPATPSYASQPPQMQPVVRTLSDVGRPAAASPVSPAAGGYRPVPVGDFNRGISRPGADTSRGAHSSLSSPGASKDGGKNPRILTVGNDILLKGEIATCDRIIIEGRVEAKLHDVHTVEIAVSGSFKGTAEVEEAEISGLFEGDLVVRTRLIIYSTGEVRGNITYGEIEIERGGRMTGQIKTSATGPGAEKSDKSSLHDLLDGKPSRGKDKDAA